MGCRHGIRHPWKTSALNVQLITPLPCARQRVSRGTSVTGSSVVAFCTRWSIAGRTQISVSSTDSSGVSPRFFRLHPGIGLTSRGVPRETSPSSGLVHADLHPLGAGLRSDLRGSYTPRSRPLGRPVHGTAVHHAARGRTKCRAGQEGTPQWCQPIHIGEDHGCARQRPLPLALRLSGSRTSMPAPTAARGGRRLVSTD